MSRYPVPVLDPSHDAWVGWDNPFQTFFAQVFAPSDLENADDDCLLWVGDRPCTFLTVPALAEVLAPWASIPPDVAHQLEQDQALATPPTPLQRRFWVLPTEVPHA